MSTFNFKIMAFQSLKSISLVLVATEIRQTSKMALQPMLMYLFSCGKVMMFAFTYSVTYGFRILL